MITEQIPPENFPGRNERQSASWDLSNARKNYISLVLAQAASAFFAFASVWLLSRYLGSEGYGGIFAIIAASQLLQVFVNWTSVSVVRFGVDEFIETEKIARTFWLRLFILLPNLLLVLLASNLWFSPLAGWLKLSPNAFWLLFLHFAASVLWIHIQFGLQAVKMPRLQGGLLTLERFLIFASLLILLFMGKLDPIAAIICYSAIPLFVALIGFFYLRKFVLARFSIDWQFFFKVISFSLPLIPVTIAGFFWGGYADAAFISTFLSIRDLGIYAVAIQISGIALQLPTLANSLLLPLFLSLQKESQFEKLQNYFKHTFPTLMLFWGILMTLSAFIGYFAISLIFGEEYVEAIAPIWILLAASTLNLPVLLGYASVSTAISTTYISMYAAILAALTNVSFNFFLIPIFGMKGCAWATVLMFFVSSSVYALFLRKKANTPISWTFLAIAPTIGGALSFSVTENSWLSLAVCLSATILVIYWKKASFREAFLFIKRFGKSLKNLMIMANTYELEISPKTRFLNFFRQIFKIRPLENFLIKKTQDLTAEDFWARLIPPNYLYAKNSHREVNRRGINYSLDISDYMEHSVYFGYRDDAQKELFRLAKNKKVLIDVGVNIGAVLLNFAKICPEALVIGFEPDAKNLLKAKRNLKLNDPGNVKIIPKGLGEEPAKVKLFKVNQANEGMNRILNDAEHILEKDFDFEEIEIVRFDDFAKENSFNAIDLIKIDVEGYELKVLKGAERSLRKYLPLLFVELDDENLKAQNDSAQSLILFLKEIGYKIYQADNRHPVESGDDFTLCHFDIVCEK